MGMRKKNQSFFVSTRSKKVQMRVAVIGAGAAGLVSIKHSLDYECEVIAFEQSDRIGGTWVSTKEVGKNEHGLDVHSSMYESLTTNLPIEVMCYPGEEFPLNENSFVSSKVVLNYYEAYADKYNLRDKIKFEHHVIRVRPIENKLWEIIVKNLRSNVFEFFVSDAILICNGHFSSKFIPPYEGREIFKGKEIHSHDYRSPESFVDEEILVIGGNFSAVDIVHQTSEKAKHVTWSHHLSIEPDLKAFGDNVSQKPDVKCLNDSGAEFIDNTSKHFTTIFYCTGYQYNFSFLSVECGISTCDEYVKPLYKHCLNINHPTMGFIGLPNLICPNQLFSLQARFCLQFMSGCKTLRTKNEMMSDYLQDMDGRWKRGLQPRKAHVMGPDIQDEYYLDIAQTAGIEPLKPVIARMHKYTHFDRNKNFVNFRNKKFFIIDDESFETRPIKFRM